jgi:two-component system chemotaxis sensor kinase CheA
MGVQTYIRSEFDDEIVEEFLMLLDMIEDNIDLVIEALKSSPEVIHDLFRMFHNLKSATGFLKLRRIHNFAHFVESALEEYRNGREIDDDIIDWLFKVANQFHTWYQNIDNDEDLAPIDPDIIKSYAKIVKAHRNG